MSDRLLTTREVAAFLGLSPETVLRRYRAGELPGYRLGSNVLRFRESEIEAWLDTCSQVPCPAAMQTLLVPERVSGLSSRNCNPEGGSER